MSEYITLSYNDIKKQITMPSNYTELKNSFFSEFNIKEVECTFKYNDEIDDIELREEESDSEFLDKIEKAKKLNAVIIAEITQNLDDMNDNDGEKNLTISTELRSGIVFKQNDNSEGKQKMEEMEQKIQELNTENKKLLKLKIETQERNKKLVEEKNKFKKMVEENKMSIERYKNEISKYKSKNPNNQQNNENYEYKLKQMEEKVKELESKEIELKLKSQQIDNLNKKLSDNTKDLENKQKAIDESKIKISLYEEKIKSYEKDINEYKSQLEQSKIEINNLKQNNEQIEKDKIDEDNLKQKYEDQIKEEKEKAEKLMNENLALFKKNVENKYKTQYEEKEKELEEKISQMSLTINQSNMSMSNFKGQDYVHKNIRCEKCLIQPIKGIRYKCSECNNYNLCEKCEEENNQEPFHDEEHNFIKLRKPVDDKEKIYSYDCSNIILLNQFIYEGTEQCEIKILLKNNGNVKWPEKKTKLIFDESSQIKADNITLLSQNVEEEKEYIVKFENLGNLKKGEYKSYLLFNVKGKNYGDKLTLIINVKEKEEMNEMEKYMKKIEEFRSTFNLSENEYTNEKIFDVLKEHNLNFEEAFSSLFTN